MRGSGPLTVIYLEDSNADAELVRRLLARSFPALDLRHVSDGVAFRGALQGPPVDVLLSDYALPGFSGREALALAREALPDTPFIFISGTMGEEIAIDMLREGATDYVLKHRMNRLAPAVTRALAEAEARRERDALGRRLDAQRRLLETVLDAVPHAIYALDRDARITAANRAACGLFAVDDPQRLVGERLEDVRLRAGDARDLAAEDRAVMQSGRSVHDEERSWRGRHGERQFAVSKQPLSSPSGSGVEGLACVILDVTERRHLERALLEASEHEQRRIGGDLHDGLGQELTGLDFMLKALETELSRLGSAHAEALAKARAVLRRALGETRRFARGLAPVGLERSGLSDALAGLIRDCAERFSIVCTFDNALPPEATPEPSRAIHLYRIVQEAIANAARHGSARHVHAQIAADGDLRIEIADDGRGFDISLLEHSGHTGMGLKLMQYRASLIGGSLMISSGSGGTRVVCRCPLPAAPRSARPAARRRPATVRSPDAP